MQGTPFAEELQQDWELLEVSVLPRETVIRVRKCTRHEVPDPTGHHISRVMSYPTIYSEHDHAEFKFRQCMLVRVWDEMAMSIRDVNQDPEFEGKSFRRYTKSALLALHSEFPTVGFHYQLIFQNSIVDIISKVAPVVLLRRGLRQ